MSNQQISSSSVGATCRLHSSISDRDSIGTAPDSNRSLDKKCDRFNRSNRWNYLFTLSLLSVLASPASAWGSSSSNKETDTSVFGNKFTRDWLYDGSALAIQVEGCVVSYVSDSEEVGCLEDESEEGTTNWYMMANCKRPQVAFSVYASDTGSVSCNSGNFKETFITTGGLSEFLYYLSSYDANYAGGDNGDGDDDGLPDCDNGDYGYLGLDCANDGSFAINYFEDQYCLTRTGNKYDSLDDVNSILSNYKSCATAYDDGSGDGTYIQQLVAYAESCSSMDSSYCQDNDVFKSRVGGSGSGHGGTSKGRSWSNSARMGGQSWVSKLKFVVGGLFLLASFIMFTGILFTNRRRRRAMMMRKYRQSRKEKGRDRKSDSSRKSNRTSSKSKRSSRNKSKDGRGEGVFT